MSQLIPAKVSLNIAETEQLYQVKRMIGGIGDMLFSIYSQMWGWDRSKSFFGEPLKHVITIRGQNLVSRTDGDPLHLRVSIQNVPVCTFKTSPCVPVSRAHV